MDFGNCKSLKINGRKKDLHESILKKASIFESLNDTNTDDPDIKIPNASDDEIDLIISSLYTHTIANSIKGFFCPSQLHKIIRMTSIMMFMGIDKNIINESIDQMLIPNTNVIRDLVCYKKQSPQDIDPVTEYHECMKIIIGRHYYPFEYATIEINAIRDMLLKTTFPDPFKIYLMQKMLIHKANFGDYDVITGITYEYQGIEPINEILDVQLNDKGQNVTNKPFIGEVIEEFYKKYLNETPNVEIAFINRRLDLQNININKKPIKLIFHEKTFTRGTIGGNVLISIVFHVSKILLGLETL